MGLSALILSLTSYADNENKLNDALGVARKFEPISVSGMVLVRTPGFTHLQS